VLPHILSVLTHLYNFLITSPSFPTAWETAIVLPLHKSRVPTALAVFRPISIISKGIERILCDQFVEYSESCGFYVTFSVWFQKISQYGYRFDEYYGMIFT
jgi:hypothetical protein